MATTTKNTLIMSSKILVLSTTLILLAILLSSFDIASIFSSLKSWLRPPYLYFLINGIIITLVASSRLHHAPSPPPSPARGPHAPPQQAQHVVSMLVRDVGIEEVKEVVDVVECHVMNQPPLEEYEVDEFRWGPPAPAPLARQEALVDFIPQRPPASARFGHNRRPAAKTPIEGGKVLRKVAKSKKQDTLESTWKAITEGRHIPLTRHLKKCDTWENNHNDDNHQIDLLNESTPIFQEVKKSQTFTDRTNYSASRVVPSITKLKKEPSLGQDELNRRVEAFINKFNEDMRLQRQQSMQQFMEMINRAA